MKGVNYVLALVILGLGLTGCEQAPPGDPTSQIAEIRAKWNQYRPTDTGTDVPYTQAPRAAAPYAAGAVTAAHLNDGLKMTKFVRYLAGLSENVYLDAGLTAQAQHGAVLLAAINGLSHSPPKPADMDDGFYQTGKASCASSNLYYESSIYNRNHSEDLDRAVRAFIHDLSNITTMGHRRWVLNPSLRQLGFGLADKAESGGYHAWYVTMQITDTGNKTDKVNLDYVLWPGKGYFPIDVFQGDEPWTVSLNPQVYDIAACRPVVTLTNVTTGREWLFSVVGDTSVLYKFFYFNRDNYGWPGCIIFRPDGLEGMSVNENRLKDNTFTVAITGLVRKDGTSGSITYEVTFFAL